mmetsp:Transcript_43894/g.171564  ORF Transcript_43894/g.171564 Transcript_43894/m.171564 type:complete len:87 (+) Transcript_43894:1044-1304(+)
MLAGEQEFFFAGGKNQPAAAVPETRHELFDQHFSALSPIAKPQGMTSNYPGSINKGDAHSPLPVANLLDAVMTRICDIFLSIARRG